MNTSLLFIQIINIIAIPVILMVIIAGIHLVNQQQLSRQNTILWRLFVMVLPVIGTIVARIYFNKSNRKPSLI